MHSPEAAMTYVEPDTDELDVTADEAGVVIEGAEPETEAAAEELPDKSQGSHAYYLSPDGRWLANVTTREGVTLENNEFMADSSHNEELRAQILGLAPGESLVRESIGQGLDGTLMVFTNTYTMQDGELIYSWAEEEYVPPEKDDADIEELESPQLLMDGETISFAPSNDFFEPTRLTAAAETDPSADALESPIEPVVPTYELPNAPETPASAPTKRNSVYALFNSQAPAPTERPSIWETFRQAEDETPSEHVAGLQAPAALSVELPQSPAETSEVSNYESVPEPSEVAVLADEQPSPETAPNDTPIEDDLAQPEQPEQAPTEPAPQQPSPDVPSGGQAEMPVISEQSSGTTETQPTSGTTETQQQVAATSPAQHEPVPAQAREQEHAVASTVTREAQAEHAPEAATVSVREISQQTVIRETQPTQIVREQHARQESAPTEAQDHHNETAADQNVAQQVDRQRSLVHATRNMPAEPRHETAPKIEVAPISSRRSPEHTVRSAPGEALRTVDVTGSKTEASAPVREQLKSSRQTEQKLTGLTETGDPAENRNSHPNSRTQVKQSSTSATRVEVTPQATEQPSPSTESATTAAKIGQPPASRVVDAVRREEVAVRAAEMPFQTEVVAKTADLKRSAPTERTRVYAPVQAELASEAVNAWAVDFGTTDDKQPLTASPAFEKQPRATGFAPSPAQTEDADIDISFDQSESSHAKRRSAATRRATV
jgi:hypothetical protein